MAPRVSGKPSHPAHHTSEDDHPTKNKDGSPVQRDSNGNVDNNKNGKADGSGIDISSTRPTDPQLAAAYDDKKQALQDQKMAGLTAKQELEASLQQIKDWTKTGEDTGTDIG